MRPIFSSVLLLCIPFACSDDSSQSETREDFCSRWGAAVCNADVVSACQASNVDACRLSQERFCLDLVPSNGFTSDRADACIDAVKSAYSDTDLTAEELGTVLRLDAPCDQLVRGTRAAGESCMSRLDCNGPEGYDCVFKAGEMTGNCEQPVVVQPGRDCTSDNALCTDGFYCNGSNCVEGGRPGEACLRNDQCADGYCGPNSVCAAGLAVNVDCTLDAQCASGLCYRFSASERVCTDRVRLSRTDPLCDNAR
jgi:hypothetical protein